MSNLKLSGEVVMVSKEITKNDFIKRILILGMDMNGDYPQEVQIEFLKDRTDLLDKVKVGDNVDVQINVRGRRWKNPETGKTTFFNTLVGWKISQATTETPKEKELDDSVEEGFDF